MTLLLTQPQVEAYCKTAGFSQTKYASLDKLPPYRVMAAVMMCEGQTEASRTRTMQTHVDYTDAHAVGDQALANTVWGFSGGFGQVRSLRSQLGTGKYRDFDRLLEPGFNAESCLTIWKQQRAKPNPPPLPNGVVAWTGFEPWTTFTQLTYQAYLQDAYPVPPTSYKVKSGDNLSLIAQRTGKGNSDTWQEVNLLANPNLIIIGQVLDQPWWNYTTRPGDTFAVLAAANHTTAARLRAFNSQPKGEPLVGQVLTIPHRLCTRSKP